MLCQHGCGHKGTHGHMWVQSQVWAGEWQAMILLPTPLLWKIITGVPQCLPETWNICKDSKQNWEHWGSLGSGDWGLVLGPELPFVQLGCLTLYILPLQN